MCLDRLTTPDCQMTEPPPRRALQAHRRPTNCILPCNSGAHPARMSPRSADVYKRQVGVTYKVTPKWLVSADFNYHGWERYSKLTLNFENNGTLVTPKNFHNTKTFRLGTQYMFTEKFAGRLGYYYDESPYTCLLYTSRCV